MKLLKTSSVNYCEHDFWEETYFDVLVLSAILILDKHVLVILR